jgi:hypothetical protein
MQNHLSMKTILPVLFALLLASGCSKQGNYDFSQIEAKMMVNPSPGFESQSMWDGPVKPYLMTDFAPFKFEGFKGKDGKYTVTFEYVVENGEYRHENTVNVPFKKNGDLFSTDYPSGAVFWDMIQMNAEDKGKMTGSFKTTCTVFAIAPRED